MISYGVLHKGHEVPAKRWVSVQVSPRRVIAGPVTIPSTCQRSRLALNWRSLWYRLSWKFTYSRRDIYILLILIAVVWNFTQHRGSSIKPTPLMSARLAVEACSPQSVCSVFSLIVRDTNINFNYACNSIVKLILDHRYHHLIIM